MASVAKLIFYLFLFVVTIAEGGKKKSGEKIVIHVPYKIHKHHHTHTKFKVIAFPPKKENTIIYLKEEAQPIVKHVAPVKTEAQVIHKEHKEPFIPPHQQSAKVLFKSLAHHKDQNKLHSDQQYLSTTVQEQKQQESHSGETAVQLVPNIVYKPILLPAHSLMPHFPLKPILLQPQHVLTPVNRVIHPSYDASYSKFSYQPIIHLPKKYMPKPILPPKELAQDNEQAGSQIYKTIINPKQNTKHYKVKEESQENVQLVKHQHQATLNSVSVPSMKSKRKGKTYFQHLKTVEDMVKSNPDYEYEHVGYLLIDGNSKKVVGKNFKDEIHLTR